MVNLIPVSIKNNILPDPLGMITVGRSWGKGIVHYYYDE